MYPEHILDYYKILNCNLGDNYLRVFKNFKSQLEKKSSKEDFKLINEAYYILGYSADRKIYDKYYKRNILYDPDIEISKKEDELFKISIKDAKEKAEEYSKLPFKIYWRKVRKVASWCFIWDLIRFQPPNPSPRV